MRLDTPRARLELRRSDVATLRNACRTRLDCLDGVAWVTIDNDRRDIVLKRGQSFVVDSNGNVLVCALQGEVVVDVQAPRRGVRCEPRAPRRSRSMWPDWLRARLPQAA